MTQLIVTSSPDILSGTPVFAGTRVPLIDGLEGGETIDDFLAGFPTVRREQVVACLEDATVRMISKASRGCFSTSASSWEGAIRLLSSAALGNTRNADVQNDFGYAYRHVGQLELVFRHYRRRSSSIRGIAARTSTPARPISSSTTRPRRESISPALERSCVIRASNTRTSRRRAPPTAGAEGSNHDTRDC